MKKTSKPRRRPPTSVLQVRVMSPRIAWYGFLRCLGKFTKFAFIFALIGAAGWGIRWGVQRALYQNPDFRLQVIDLNKNSAIDEMEFVQITDLDLSANLLDLDLDKITDRLLKIPALSSVKVERHLPGTLSIRVTARAPLAWIASSREIGAMLVDENHVAYPCTTYQLETAVGLPIIQLPASDEHPVTAGQKVLQPELQRCLRLLSAAANADPEAVHGIESIRQANAWSLELVTRDGTFATFGLGDHERQIANFRAAIDHAARNNSSIATINLIPKENVPVTFRNEVPPPPRAVAVPEPVSSDKHEDRRAHDLDTILNSR